MKVCNIVIDFNHMFHSEFGVYTAYNRSARFTSEKDEISFIQGVANKMFYALSHLPSGGKVVCCIDSRSWRKSVDIPGGGYKIRREDADGGKGQMDKATKERFYKLMDEYAKAINDVGIIASKIAGAEGDDLIFKWTEYFTHRGENVVIVSGDRDMTQLVNNSSTDDSYEPWVIQWNNSSKNSKMFIPAGWQQNWLTTKSDIFNMDMSADRQTIKRHISDFAIQLNVINPSVVVLDKILLGDDGDDVPPAWRYSGKTKKGEPKTINLTETVAVKIIDAVRTKYNIEPAEIIKRFTDDEFMIDISGIILRIMKDIDGSSERLPVMESLRRNQKLMQLSSDMLPNNLQQDIETHITTCVDDLITHRHKWNRKALFEGTRFSENAVSRRDDPFAFFGVPD